MARHAVPRPSRRILLQAGLTVTAVGAALSAGAGAAQAAPAPAADSGRAVKDSGTPGGALTNALSHSLAGGLGPAKSLRLDPLAGTASDPLNNTIGTQIADFKPLSTGAVTGVLAEGGALEDLPVVGAVTKLLPG